MGTINGWNICICGLHPEGIAELFYTCGDPTHLRSYNGPEFIPPQLSQWLSRLGLKTLFIELGSPRENSYIELFNGKNLAELLGREIFFILKETKILIMRWKEEYNQFRPHSALDYHPPAPQTWLVTAKLVSGPSLP